MSKASLSADQILALIHGGVKLPWATHSYPSRGQTSTQEIYLTKDGKLFLKRVSKQNHIDCQIDPETGTLAEREFWAHELSVRLGLATPELWLIDSRTTVQRWLDFPDGRQYATSHGKMLLSVENVFECAVFDWLTGQVDRHDANYLYDYVHQKIILIDSAHGFLKYTGSIPDYLKYAEVIFKSDELRRSVKSSIHESLKLLTSRELKKIVRLKDAEEEASLKNRLEDLKTISCIQDILTFYRKG